MTIPLHSCTDCTSLPSPDPRPGDYFVSAIDKLDNTGYVPQSRIALASGPYTTHELALAAVASVKRLVERVDPRAVWYAWGTARMDMGSRMVGFVEQHGLR